MRRKRGVFVPAGTAVDVATKTEFEARILHWLQTGLITSLTIDLVRLSDTSVHEHMSVQTDHGSKYPDSPVGMLVEDYGNLSNPTNAKAAQMERDGSLLRLTRRGIANHWSDAYVGVAFVHDGKLCIYYSGTGAVFDLPAPSGREHEAKSTWVEIIASSVMLYAKQGMTPEPRLAASSRWARDTHVANAAARVIHEYGAKLWLDGKEAPTGDLATIVSALQTSQSEAYRQTTIKATVKGKTKKYTGTDREGDGFAGMALYGEKIVWFILKVRPIVEVDPVTGQVTERPPSRSGKEKVVLEPNPAMTPLAAEALEKLANYEKWADVATWLGSRGVLSRRHKDRRSMAQLHNKGAALRDLMTDLVPALLSGELYHVTHARVLDINDIPRHLLEAEYPEPRVRVTDGKLDGETMWKIEMWVPLPMDDVLRTIPYETLRKVYERLQEGGGRGATSGVRMPFARTCRQRLDEDTWRLLYSADPKLYFVETPHNKDRNRPHTVGTHGVKQAMVSTATFLTHVGRAIRDAADQAQVGQVPLADRTQADRREAWRMRLAAIDSEILTVQKTITGSSTLMAEATASGDTKQLSEQREVRDNARATHERLLSEQAHLLAELDAPIETGHADVDAYTIVGIGIACERYHRLSAEAKAALTNLVDRWVGRTFQWSLTEDRLGVAWSFTLDAETTEQSRIVLPVSGVIPVSLFQQSRAAGQNSPLRVTHVPQDTKQIYAEAIMLHGRSIREVGAIRNQSRKHYYATSYLFAKEKIAELGVTAPELQAAILDCPLPETKKTLWLALNDPSTCDPWAQHLLETYTGTIPWVGRRWLALDDTGARALHAALKANPGAHAAELIATTGLDYDGDLSTTSWASIRTAIRGPRCMRTKKPWGVHDHRPGVVSWVRADGGQYDPVETKTFHLLPCPRTGCTGHLYPLPVPEVPGGLACDTCHRVPAPTAATALRIPAYYFENALTLIVEGNPKAKRRSLRSAAEPLT